MRNLIFLTALGLLSTQAFAQSTPCSTLTLAGSFAPGQTLSIDLTGGTADAFTLLAVGQDLGSTSLTFGPLGTLTLGLDHPFVLVPFGFTDASGAVSRSVSLPAGASPSLPSLTIQLQAVNVNLSFSFPGPPSLNFCTSNVTSLSF